MDPAIPLLPLTKMDPHVAQAQGKSEWPTYVMAPVDPNKPISDSYVSMSRFANPFCKIQLRVIERFNFKEGAGPSDGSHSQGSNRPNGLDASLGSASGVCRTSRQGSSPSMLRKSTLRGYNIAVLPASAEHVHKVSLYTFRPN